MQRAFWRESLEHTTPYQNVKGSLSLLSIIVHAGKQNNIVNHPRVRPYSQPAKCNTFPCLSLELKAESAGGVLTTAEAQAAGSGSHSLNSILWLLEEAKAAGLTEVDLMRDTVFFSIVSSHRQAIAYLH